LPQTDISDITDIKMVDILVRDVSPELHRALKIEAARQGTTLANYVRILMEKRLGTYGEPFDETALERLGKMREGLPDLSHVDWSDLSWRASRELDERDEERAGSLVPHTPAKSA
jgi:plasmid stability protein